MTNSHFELVGYLEAFNLTKAIFESWWNRTRKPHLLFLGRYSRIPRHVHHRLRYLHRILGCVADASFNTWQELFGELVSDLFLEGCMRGANISRVDL